MRLLADAMSGLGAALLPVAAALLFEELTFGGLVRLLLAPWPGARKHGAAQRRIVATCGRKEHKPPHKPKTVCGDPGDYNPEIRRREMIALKTLLMIAGVLLMAVAAGDSAAWIVDADSVCDEEEVRRGWDAVWSRALLNRSLVRLRGAGRWRWRWWRACRC